MPEFSRRRTPDAVRRRVLGAVLFVLPSLAPAGEPAPALIAVAANLTHAAEALARDFAARGHGRLRLSYGSSGNLVRQIAHGAPYELFLSADAGHARRVVEAGRAAQQPQVYAVGRLALLVHAGAGIAPGTPLETALAALRADRRARVAIANPELAPYGHAAREALRSYGVWLPLAERLVLGENAGQTTRFVLTGAAAAGLVPLSHARLAPVARSTHYQPVPADRHAPLAQALVLLRGASAPAHAFADFVLGPYGRAVLAAHDYELPP